MELHLPTTLVLPFFKLYFRVRCDVQNLLKISFRASSHRIASPLEIQLILDYLSNSVVGLPELIHENTAMASQWLAHQRQSSRYRVFSSKTVVSYIQLGENSNSLRERGCLRGIYGTV